MTKPRRLISDTTHPRSKWKQGMRFLRTMGIPHSGVVVTARELPDHLHHYLFSHGPFRHPVIPVRYDSGRYGYEHPCHLIKLR